uniref:Insulin-like domain-containing protein n=1 Tax=Glossina austeni TaxID=7395 RepID=A0A1A9VT25_GLOAU
MKLITFLAALVVLTARETHGTAQRYCGVLLDQALTVICQNGFNKKITKKSADAPILLNADWFMAQDELLPYPYGFRNLANQFTDETAAILTQTRRRRYGIYDECCRLKGCTFQELDSYCKKD